MARDRAQYTTVDCTILAIRPSSILIEVDGVDHSVWVGRSTIYGPQDREINDIDCPYDFEGLQIMTWLVQKEGLA